MVNAGSLRQRRFLREAILLTTQARFTATTGQHQTTTFLFIVMYRARASVLMHKWLAMKLGSSMITVASGRGRTPCLKSVEQRLAS